MFDAFDSLSGGGALADLLPELATVLVLIWLFAIGSAVGSFLNVVIYRLPQNLSVVRPSSHCPHCQTPIATRDNLPIFGWLLLRGRCRACQAKISWRYPVVEFTVAVLFTLFAYLEPIGWCANLPREPAFAWSDTALWAIYAYHMVLLCALLAAVLIQADGYPLALRLLLPPLVIGLLLPVVWPELRPVPALANLFGQDTAGSWYPGTWMAGLVDGVVGLAVGLVLGCLAWPAGVLGPSGARPPVAAAGSLVWVAVFLGWQATAALASATALLVLFAAVIGRVCAPLRRVSWTGYLLLVTLFWLLAWKTIVRHLPYLGRDAGGTTLLAAGACVALFSVLAWKFGRPAVD